MWSCGSLDWIVSFHGDKANGATLIKWSWQVEHWKERSIGKKKKNTKMICDWGFFFAICSDFFTFKGNLITASGGKHNCLRVPAIKHSPAALHQQWLVNYRIIAQTSLVHNLGWSKNDAIWGCYYEQKRHIWRKGRRGKRTVTIHWGINMLVTHTSSLSLFLSVSHTLLHPLILF